MIAVDKCCLRCRHAMTLDQYGLHPDAVAVRVYVCKACNYIHVEHETVRRIATPNFEYFA